MRALQPDELEHCVQSLHAGGRYIWSRPALVLSVVEGRKKKVGSALMNDHGEPEPIDTTAWEGKRFRSSSMQTMPAGDESQSEAVAIQMARSRGYIC